MGSDPLSLLRDRLAWRALAVLEESLRNGQWGNTLPSERKLCEILNISRMTLRQALAELERRGAITSGRGKRRRILGYSGGKADQTHNIVFLSPVHLEEMDSQLVLLIHRLSENLHQIGVKLEVEVRPSCFTRQPERALQAVTSEYGATGWILFRGNRAGQEWFRNSGLPFIVLGSTFINNTPSIGSEHLAIGTHAAGQFLRLRHQHGVIIAPRHEPGALTDDDLAYGFQRVGLTFRCVFHDRSRTSLLHALEKVLAIRPHVTAIFAIGGQYSVTLLSALLSKGIRVPEDISFIVMGRDPAFSYLVPAPTHYTLSMEKGVRMLFRLVCRVILEGDRSLGRIELLPDFVPGETLGVCTTVG